MYSTITKLNLCGLWTALLWTYSLAATPPTVGDAFPALGTAHVEGTLPDTQGKVVLVDFWASWCGPCRQAFPELEKLHQELGPKGLVILGMSVDDKATDMERFLKRTPVTFPVVRDAKKTLVSLLQVKSMPTSYLIDSKGNIRFIHSGFNGADTVAELKKELNHLLEEQP